MIAAVVVALCFLGLLLRQWYTSERWIWARKCKKCGYVLTYKEYKQRLCPRDGWFGESNG